MSSHLADWVGIKYIGRMTRPTVYEPDLPCEASGMEDAELEKLARDYTRAETTADRLRPQLYAHIYDFKQRWGDERGWQTMVVKLTGLTRERIRQIIAAEEKRRAAE
jgi:hypothetical protein